MCVGLAFTRFGKNASESKLQLMELAGLGVAQCVCEAYSTAQNVLIIAGSGNNGGDGLVCARHLKHFGCNPKVYYPKSTGKSIYKALCLQLESVNVEIVSDLSSALSWADVLVDALLGFGSNGALRAPFDQLVSLMNACKKPIVCVDIPSGWDVHEGNKYKNGIEPSVIVSLMMPKLFVKNSSSELRGKVRHFITGRFLPDYIIKMYDLLPPRYEAAKSFVEDFYE